MPSVTFWIGYGVLTILTVATAATGRNIFLVAIANSVLAILWWAADANGYEIPSESDLLVLGWGILLLPYALIASVISTGIGRVVYSHRMRPQQQEHAEQHSGIQDSGVTSEQRGFLQRQALISVGIATVLAFGGIILNLKDQHSTPYFFADQLLGGVAFGSGCMLYARSKGRTRWWALMGALWALPGGRLLALIFFVLLVSLAGQPVSSAARSQTS